MSNNPDPFIVGGSLVLGAFVLVLAWGFGMDVLIDYGHAPTGTLGTLVLPFLAIIGILVALVVGAAVAVGVLYALGVSAIKAHATVTTRVSAWRAYLGGDRS